MQAVVISFLLALTGGLALFTTLPREETDARCSITLKQGGEVELAYRTRAWDEQAVQKMRADAEARERANQRLPLLIRGELTTPVDLRVGEVLVKAGKHRLALSMNRAGAWELSLLKDQVLHGVPLVLGSGDAEFPFLCMVLTPSRRGVCELVVQWGRETGRVVFQTPS